MLVRVIALVAGQRRRVEVDTSDVLELCDEEDLAEALDDCRYRGPRPDKGMLERWKVWAAS